jgi:hypothetical protein
MTKRWIAAIGLLVLVGGCSEMPFYQQGFGMAVGLHDQAVRDRQAFHDEQMKLSLDLVCDNSVGAIGRLQDEVSKVYILRHCGVVSGVGTGGFGSAMFMGPP